MDDRTLPANPTNTPAGATTLPETTWDDLPEDIRALLGGLATEPTYEELVAGRAVDVADGR